MEIHGDFFKALFGGCMTPFKLRLFRFSLYGNHPLIYVPKKWRIFDAPEKWRIFDLRSEVLF
jgi:hypothetical protein